MNLQLSDKTAFKQVFERYYPLLCLYVKSMLASEEDAEDVVEELFIALWLQNKSFQDQDSLRFYLYRLAKNATLNYLKATARRLAKHEKAYHESEKISLDHSHAFIKAEVIHAIMEEIEKLPPQESKILMLTFRQGLAVQQIADELSLSVQTVKNCKYRATNKLKIKFMGNIPVLLILYVCSHL